MKMLYLAIQGHGTVLSGRSCVDESWRTACCCSAAACFAFVWISRATQCLGLLPCLTLSLASNGFELHSLLPTLLGATFTPSGEFVLCQRREWSFASTSKYFQLSPSCQEYLRGDTHLDS